MQILHKEIKKSSCFISLMCYYTNAIEIDLLEEIKMKKMNMKKMICLLLVLTMALALCACGKKEAFVVGITDFAPMDYKDDSGEWIGFDADMARAFAEYLGQDVEFIEIDWDNKILELDAGNIDAVWNGMTLTDEVLNSMDCGTPYCNNAQVVVVNAAVADQYQDVASLAGLKFAVEAGSAGEDAVIELGNEYNAVLTQAVALMEVAAGTSDACIIDLLMAGAMIGEGTSYPELTYTVKLTTEEYGVGFKKGSGLAEKFIDFYAKAYADGTVMEIAEKYGVQESIIAK